MSIIPADQINSSVQSGQFVEEHKCMRAGMNDKEFIAGSVKDKDGGLAFDDTEAGTGCRGDTMDNLMIQKDVEQVTPSSGLIHHHTDKFTKYPNTNTMEFVVPEGDRIPMGGGQNTSNTIPDTEGCWTSNAI